MSFITCLGPGSFSVLSCGNKVYSSEIISVTSIRSSCNLFLFSTVTWVCGRYRPMLMRMPSPRSLLSHNGYVSLSTLDTIPDRLRLQDCLS